jgi:hypothetical protein
MKKVIVLVKENWSDPVWSKVFAAIIISGLGSIGVAIWSLIKQVPFVSFFTYLQSNEIKLNYLSIVISIVILLAILVPMVTLKLVTFQLKRSRAPIQLTSKQFNINGKWACTFQNRLNNGAEIAVINDGNKYHLNGQLYFVLTDIHVDLKEKTIEWSKISFPQIVKHSRETLQIVSDRELVGRDDIGYDVSYKKID